jgi:hypothetical protein
MLLKAAKRYSLLGSAWRKSDDMLVFELVMVSWAEEIAV